MNPLRSGDEKAAMTPSDPSATHASAAAPLDPLALRRAFGAFMTGVTIVTTRDADGAPRGFTANSFTSVSLDPPLLLICIGAGASSRPAFEAATGFAVSILAEDQAAAASAFASRGVDRFAEVAHRDGPQGRPIIEGAAAWFDCDVERRVEAGDHLILIGRIRAFDSTDANGLGYARGGYFTLSAAHAALRAASHGGLRVGALVERPNQSAGEILLEPDGAGGWRPPSVDVGDHEDGAAALEARLRALGLDVTLGPVYAVFKAKRTGLEHVYYRAAAGAAAKSAEGLFFDIDALPFDAISGEALGAMLRTYAAEHRGRRFNIRFGARG